MWQVSSFARCSVIRQLAVRSQIGQTDRFRIQVQEHGRKDVLGRREIAATLQQSASVVETAIEGDSLRFEGVSSPGFTEHSPQRQFAFPNQRHVGTLLFSICAGFAIP